VILPRCAARIDLLSGHHYTQRRFKVPFSAEDARKYEENFIGYSASVSEGVRRIINDMRARQDGSDLAIDCVRLSVDEWGIVREWNPEPDAPGVGIYEVYYPLGDAIAIGRALHELLRSADIVEIAQWAQTVNIIGAIKTSRTHASMGSVGHLLTLYRAQVNGHILPVDVAGEVPVDAVAAWDPKSRTVSVGLINYSAHDDIAVEFDLRGAAASEHTTVWRINGPSLGSTNVPGKPEAVTTTRLPEPVSVTKPLVLPAHSISVLNITISGR
jgi:alpha-N-arabinofuranosidase